ncbi:XRE family transcriptional regulator [Streptomyces kanamyceticus]|nr:XRE family transcriptional regulator [Streptomyces kanamyceticus]
MHDVWRTVVEGVTGSMAYIADRNWKLKACNAEFEALFPGGRAPSNIMRWMLLDEQARQHTLTDWSEYWAPAACPALRQAVTDRPADPELIDMATDVRLDPVVGPIYLATESSNAVHPDGAVRPIRHPVKGPGWLITSAANPLTEIDARVVIMQFKPGTTRPHQPSPLSRENMWQPQAPAWTADKP